MRSLVVALLAAALLVVPAASGRTIALDEYGAGITPGANPTAIVRGGDGAMWFTEFGQYSSLLGYPTSGAIGRIDADGRVTEFRAGLPVGAHPHTLIRGRDGVLWFTDGEGRWIGRVDGAGTITTFGLGLRRAATLRAVALGNDGNVWFVAGHGEVVGRVTPAGKVRRWRQALPKRLLASGRAVSMATGPGGRPWVVAGGWTGIVDTKRHRIGWRRVGAVKGLGAVQRLEHVAPGANRTMWVLSARGELVRLSRSGRVLSGLSNVRLRQAQGVLAGPDGHVWITARSPDRLVEVVGRRVVVHGSAAGEGPDGLVPGGLALGAGGGMWLTGLDRIARVLPGPACRVPDVVALEEGEARAAVEAAGCGVAVVRGEQDGPGPIRVTAQSATLRRALPLGATVTLTVGPLALPCRWPEGTQNVRAIEGGALGETVVWRTATKAEHRTTLCVAESGFLQRVWTSVIDFADDGDYASTSFAGARLAGAYVLIVSSGGEKYGTTWGALDLLDLRTGAQRPIASVNGSSGSGPDITAYALRSDGAVAWVEREYTSRTSAFEERVLVRLPGHEQRLLSTVPASKVTDLRFDGDTVAWTADGASRSAAVG